MRRFLLAAFCGALFAFAPAHAHARDAQLSLQLSAGPYGGYMRALPAMARETPIETSARTVAPGRLPSAGPLTYAGGTFDLGEILNDRVVFPLIGFGIGASVGERPRVATSLDGSIAELHPWTTIMVDVLLPGIGLRWKERRWLFAATLRTGVGITTMDASVAHGTDSTQLSPVATSFLLRGEIQACRRFDPTQRACLYAAPTLYEFGWANGGTVGLRWEYGQ